MMPLNALDKERRMYDYPQVTQSLETYERAGKLIPGWTQLISRRASQFANGVSPIYAQRAKGARFVDIDGNEYIDWVSAVGAIILGHADEVVDQAVKEQIDRGSLYSLNSPLEIELAEELVNTIPSAEMVRYTKGGGEACAVAVRIARGTSGKDKILFCGYHGWHDWYQAANYLENPEDGEFPFAGIEPIGVPQVLANTVIPFAYGDLTMLEDLLKTNRNQIAAIMMEPIRSTLPEPGYLEGVKALAQEHGVILIFDEVSCGWRLSVGGVQKYLNVVPDMTVVAKAMSNGYPMGAVVGSRTVMEPADRMFISSSYWSDNIGLVAALTTIRELKQRNSETRFKEIGQRLSAEINRAIADVGLSGACTGLYTNPGITLDLPDVTLAPKIKTLFIQEMSSRGVLCYTAFKPTLAHTEEDINLTVQAIIDTLTVIQSGLESDGIDNLLACDIRQDPFRRLVQ